MIPGNVTLNNQEITKKISLVNASNNYWELFNTSQILPRIFTINDVIIEPIALTSFTLSTKFLKNLNFFS